MLTGAQMIEEALRRIAVGEPPEIVLPDVFGPVLKAAAYAAQKGKDLSQGNADADDLIRACTKCEKAIGVEEEEENS